MKSVKFFLFAALAMGIAGAGYAQTGWEQIAPVYENISLSSVTFLNPAIGIAVGNNGVIMRSIDSGQSWHEEYVYQFQNLRCVVAISPISVMICGDSGTILKSTNAGVSWLPMQSGTYSNLKALSFLDSTTGFAAGDNRGLTENFILKTTNGGLNWAIILIPDTIQQFIQGISALDNDTINCITTNYVIRTSDGGLTWFVVDSISIYETLTTIDFYDKDTGIAIGWDGIILRTTNSGVDWQAMANILEYDGIGINLYGMYLTKNNSVIGGDYGDLYYSIDFGITWKSLGYTSNNPVISISFSTDTYATSVGSGSAVIDQVANTPVSNSSNGGKTWTPQYFINKTSFRSIFAIDTNYIFAIGDSCNFLRSSDGGFYWSRPMQLSPFSLRSISFDGYNFGLCVGDSGRIFTSNDTGKTWNQHKSHSTVNLNSDFLFDNSQIYIAGDSGTILTTSNGGNTWIVQQSGIETNLRSIYFIDSQNGFAVGDSGIIISTTNGGTSWVKINSHTKNNLTAISFDNGGEGAIIGKNNTVLWTTDNGNTWEFININVTCDLYSLVFTSNGTCYIAGTNGMVFQISNHGKSINHLSVPINVNYYSINKSGSDTIYLAGDSSVILKTKTDGIYAFWQDQNPFPALGSYIDFHYTNMDTQYVIGNDGIRKSTNGGTTWIKQPNPNIAINAFDFSNENDWYMIHNGDSIYTSFDKGVTWAFQMFYNNPSPLVTIDFIDSLHGFAAGENGAFIRTTTGGATWDSAYDGILNIHDMYFNNPNDGIIVGTCLSASTGSGPGISITTNAGNKWKYLNVANDAPNFNSIAFANIDTGICVGANGELAYSFDQGISWQMDTNNITDNNLNKLLFLNNGQGFIVGDNGIILKTSNSGTSWKSQNTNISSNLYNISFLNDTMGAAEGANGTLIKTTNGGITWFTQNRLTTNNLKRVSCPDTNTAFIVGMWGTILHTGNAGVTWMNESNATLNDLYGTYFVNNNTGMVVGLHGAIFFTSNGGLNWVNSSYDSTNYYAVYITNNQSCFVVGDSGTILKSTNNGNQWNTYNLPTKSTLRSVAFNKANNGVVVGDNGTLLQTLDGGLTWNNLGYGANNIYSVCFSNGDTCFAVSDGTEWVQPDPHYGFSIDVYYIMKSTNAGLTWSSIATNYENPQTSWNQYGNHFFCINFEDSVNGWVCGESGSIARTTDGGNTWFSANSTSSNYLYGISMVHHTGYAVGDNGTILRLTYGGLKSEEYISYASSSINFGNVHINSSKTDSVTITNPTSDTIAVNLTSYSNPLFSVAPLTAIVPPSQSQTFIFSFSPDELNAQNGIFIFTYNELQFEDTIQVTGIGIDDNGAVFEPNTRELDFGNVKQDSSLTKYISVSNPGDSSLWVYPIISTNPRFNDGVESNTILSNHSYAFPITFTPDSSVPGAVLPYTGYIIFTSNALTSPDTVIVTGGGLSGVKEIASAIPGSFALEQNYPNPFNPSTSISFSIPRQSQVKLCVYNILGELVATLANGTLPAGSYNANFDGSSLPNGVYFYTLTAGQYGATREMMLER